MTVQIRGETQILDKSIPKAKLMDTVFNGVLHDAGQATPVVVSDAHTSYELSCEGGAGFDLNVSKLTEGNWFYVVNKHTADVSSAIAFTGFTTVSDVLNDGAAISGPLALQKNETALIRVSKKGADWLCHVYKLGAGKTQVFISDTAPTPIPNYDAEWLKPIAAAARTKFLRIRVRQNEYFFIYDAAGDFLITSQAELDSLVTVTGSGSINFDQAGFFGFNVTALTTYDFAIDFKWQFLFPVGVDGADFDVVVVDAATGVETPLTQGTALDSAGNSVTNATTLIEGRAGFIYTHPEYLTGAADPNDFDIYANIKDSAGVRHWIKKAAAASSASIDKMLGVALADENLGTFAQDIIPDNVSIKAALQALENQVSGLKVTGEMFLPSAAKFADLTTAMTLPDGSTVTAGKNDITVLNTDDIGTGTADAPQYPAGFYIHDGTSYSLLLKIQPVTLTADKFKKGVTLTGTVDGTNKVFTIPETFVAGSLEVKLNGQDKYLTEDYTLSGQEVTLNTAPSSALGYADKVKANYIVP